jgi:hypothetical protein
MGLDYKIMVLLRLVTVVWLGGTIRRINHPTSNSNLKIFINHHPSLPQ